jgi:hypothetical protein
LSFDGLVSAGEGFAKEGMLVEAADSMAQAVQTR